MDGIRRALLSVSDKRDLADFASRLVVLAGDTRQAQASLRAYAAGEKSEHAVTGDARGRGKAVFVFPGQGSQWAGMGRALLEESEIFAQTIAECEQALAPYIDF